MKSSKIVLGTVQFGLDYGINNQSGKPDESKVFDILNLAKKSGISELDTADGYGNSTDILGRYLFQYPNSFQVMSKLSLNNNSDFTDKFIASLSRLNIQEIEGYYFHSFPEFNKFDDFDQIHKLKKSGQLKNLGVSLYTDDELAIAVEHPEVDVIQLPFNILDRGERKMELLKKAKSFNKKIYVRSVFLQGLFFMSPSNLPLKLKPLEDTLTEIQNLAKFNKMNIQEMCLNYVFHKTFIDKLVLGIDSVEQLNINVKSIKSSFPSDVEKSLENILIKDLSLLNPGNWK